MSEPLIEGQTADLEKLTKALRDMADSVQANGIASFGGCFVVLPPMGLDPMSTLILDNKQDAAQFYAMLKTKCDIALASIDEQQRMSQGYRR